MLLPIFVRQLSGDLLQLIGKAFFTGNLIFPFQYRRNRVPMLRAVLPKVRTAGIVPTASVGDIKDVPDSRPVAGDVDEGDPLAAASDISAHFFIPKLIPGAGRRVRALGENHELFVIRIFVKPRGGFEKIRPAFMTGGDLRRRAVGHLRQSLHITWHIEILPFGLSDKKKQPEGCLFDKKHSVLFN
ncbi:MAG: hypothetical protein LKJ59_07210 [Oscillospiraceae bacterium]|nr:hypothetical protein [Oscillospiraceae bacterium]MCI2036240.1 hypothetical protein [Oscillospiraceae bacterium]